MIFADLIQPIDVPATLIALGTLVGAVTGLIAMWVNIKAKLEEIGANAKAAKDLTIKGNADHADALEVVRKDVNSATQRATDAAKTAADEKQAVAVEIATLQAEKAAAVKASELAARDREEALRISAAHATEAADLREQLRLEQARKVVEGPAEVIVKNPPENPANVRVEPEKEV